MGAPVNVVINFNHKCNKYRNSYGSEFVSLFMGTSGVKEVFNISRAVTRVVICENQCDARQMKLSRLRHGFKGRSSFEEKTYEVQLIFVAVLLKVINFKGIGRFKLT